MIERPEARRLMDQAQITADPSTSREFIQRNLCVPAPPAVPTVAPGEPTIMDVLMVNRFNPTTAWTSGERSEPIVDSLTGDMWSPAFTNTYTTYYP